MRKHPDYLFGGIMQDYAFNRSGRGRRAVRRSTLGLVALSLSCTTMLTSAALSADTSFVGAGSDWFMNSYWSGGVVPTSSDTAIINGGASVTVNGGAAEAHVLNIGMTASGTPSLAIGPGGSLTVLNGVIGGPDGAASVSVGGAGATFTNTSELTIGRRGTGSLTVDTGGHLVTRRLALATPTWEVNGGVQPGGSGTLTVTGSGTLWENEGGVDVGRGANASGKLTVADGATAHIYSTGLYAGAGAEILITGNGTRVEIGDPSQPNNAPRSGWLSPDGGSITVSDGASLYASGAYIGAGGASLATMTVTGAGTDYTVEQLLYVGGQNGSNNVDPMNGNGRLTVSAGAKAQGGAVGVGMDPNSKGVVTVTGAGSELWSKANAGLTAPTAGNFYVGYAGDGLVTVSNGAAIKADNEIRLAYGDSASAGRLVIGAERGLAASGAGSVSATNGIVFGPGTSQLVFNHTSDNYDFASRLRGTGEIFADAGNTTLSGDATGFQGLVSVALGATLGIEGGIGGNSSFDLAGTLSGGNGLVELAAGGNSFDIYNSARFVGGVDFGGYGSNTLNFYTGSYTMPVEGYALGDPSNAINALGTAKTVITTGLDSSGNGNIILVDSSAIATVDRTAGDTQRQVSGVIQDIMNLDIERPNVEVAPLAYGEDSPVKRKAAALGLLKDGEQATAFDAAGNLAWARGFYGIRQQQAESGPDSSGRQFGMLAGLDRMIDAWRIGVFGGAGRSLTDLSADAGGSDSDMVLGGLYGRRSLGELSLDMALTTGRVWTETERSVNMGTETANADFGGWFVAPEVALSKSVPLDDRWSLTPSLRGRYIATFYEAYSETGSSQNTSYDAHVTQSFDERADLRLSYKATDEAGLSSRYWVSAGASATQRVGASSYGATVAGGDFAVTTTGDGLLLSGLLSAGFDAMVGPSATLFGAVEAAADTDEAWSVQARGGFKLAF